MSCRYVLSFQPRAYINIPKAGCEREGRKKKKKKLMSFTYKLPRMNDNLLPLQIRIPSYHKGV